MADQSTEPTKFKVKGRTYTLLGEDDLELAEIEQIEDAFGLPWEEIDPRRTKAVRYFIFFSMQRVKPDVKFEDIGSLKFADIAEDEEAPAAKRPTKAKASKAKAA